MKLETQPLVTVTSETLKIEVPTFQTDRLVDHETLRKMKAAKRKWFAKGLFPMGLICLYGEPKIGKSWLGLQLAKAVVSGKGVFGKRIGYRGDVLYWPLEDDVTRLQERMKVQEWEKRYPYRVWLPFDANDRIVHPLSLKASMERLEQWIAKVRPILVIIDPLLDFAGFSSVNFYRNESMGPLMKQFLGFRDKYGCAIYLIHHSRKKLKDGEEEGVDSLYGGRAISALSDGLIRIHGRKENRILEFTLRDGPDVDLQVELIDGLWSESE